ncbi:MAG: hypothetical protein JXX29_15015 [Deltaproteobacteria bacterium]|nr:hypothetical protein [Deltaproteobacteria bacterium]
MNPEFKQKPGTLSDITSILSDKRLTHGERVLYCYFIVRADNRGIVWESQKVLAKKTASSDKGIIKMTKKMLGTGHLLIGEFKCGAMLPSGNPANSDRLAYFLVPKYFTPLKKAGKIARDSRLFFERIALGVEHSSMPATSIGVEHRSMEQPSRQGVNSVPKTVEQRSGSLQDRTIKNKKEPNGQEKPAFRKVTNRVSALASQLENDEAIDPEFLRFAIAESVEDKIGIPDAMQNCLMALERRHLLSRLPSRKIDHIAWTTPTPLSQLLASRCPITGNSEELDQLVSHAQNHMVLDFGDKE